VVNIEVISEKFNVDSHPQIRKKSFTKLQESRNDSAGHGSRAI
jgi:hypothetical protein